MGSSNPQDNLTAAFAGHTVVLRVEGRGSFKICPPLKQFVLRSIDSQAAYRILIDMSGCVTMDSTFMGVLAGLSYHLKAKPGCTLKLLYLSEKNRRLLTTLGVDRVVKSTLSADEDEAELLRSLKEEIRPLESDPATALESAKTTLKAHETLVELHPENADRFRSVLELLQKDVDNLNNR